MGTLQQRTSTKQKESTIFKLKAADIKLNCAACFPDNWDPETCMAFMFACNGAGSPLRVAQSPKRLNADVKALLEAKKPAPAKSNTGAAQKAAKRKPAAKKVWAPKCSAKSQAESRANAILQQIMANFGNLIII